MNFSFNIVLAIIGKVIIFFHVLWSYRIELSWGSDWIQKYSNQIYWNWDFLYFSNVIRIDYMLRIEYYEPVESYIPLLKNA